MGKDKNKDKKGGFPFFVIFLLMGSIIFVPLYIVYRVFVKGLEEEEDIVVRSTPRERLESDEVQQVDSSDESSDSMVALKKVASPVKTQQPEESLVGEPAAKKEVQLSSRQQEILEFISSNEEVDTTILHAKFKDVTVRTLRRDLKTLMDAGLVEKLGETKGATYKKI